jgi:hypothetical protein
MLGCKFNLLVNSSQKVQLAYLRRGYRLSHCDLAIYIKTYLKAKEELRKLKYLTMQKI